MAKALDLKGKRFGRLVAIDFQSDSGSQRQWRCICDCGQEYFVNTNSLTSGKTKSCGCLLKDFRKLSFGKAAFNRVLRRYKRQARDRGFKFDLNEKFFQRIISKNCHYCGKSPGQISYEKNFNGEYLYNGIDRIDSSKGYYPKNVVPCCKYCNRMKNDLSLNAFKKHIIKIAERFQDEQKNNI